MNNQEHLLTVLVATLQNHGYDAAGLETTDQSVGYGFGLTGLYREGQPVSLGEVRQVEEDLTDLGLLDLDWDGVLGEDAHGYATITIKKED